MELDELKILADERGFNIEIIEKDYLVTYLLYLLKEIKGIYFKGGTAINKILLNHQRISEDLDFSVKRNVTEVEKEIKNKLRNTIFSKITHDKRVDKFTRLIAHYKLFHEPGTIFIDLNERSKLILEPQDLPIEHFYKDEMPEFEVPCLNKKELIAEKVMATCQRYRPRDYLDLYFLIKSNIPIELNLVKRKFRANKLEFTVFLMFKNTDKIFNQWKDDLFMLTKTRPSFQEVMKTLSDYFKLKEEKEKLKKSQVAK